mmetsp:Transcript_4717/g.14393  ORF Transcript_4717/g.14393 Transcript_4717/m.14393 type:complete len:253 (-) Transcript_4717:26-784(-)
MNLPLLAHGVAAVLGIESHTGLARESALPQAPRLRRLGIEGLIRIHDGLPAAAKLLGVILHRRTARPGNIVQLMNVTASLLDGKAESQHVHLRLTTGIHGMESGVSGLRISLSLRSGSRHRFLLSDGGLLLLLLRGGSGLLLLLLLPILSRKRSFNTTFSSSCLRNLGILFSRSLGLVLVFDQGLSSLDRLSSLLRRLKRHRVLSRYEVPATHQFILARRGDDMNQKGQAQGRYHKESKRRLLCGAHSVSSR